MVKGLIIAATCGTVAFFALDLSGKYYGYADVMFQALYTEVCEVIFTETGGLRVCAML
jgi:hypothetical protein